MVRWYGTITWHKLHMNIGMIMDFHFHLHSVPYFALGALKTITDPQPIIRKVTGSKLEDQNYVVRRASYQMKKGKRKTSE